MREQREHSRSREHVDDICETTSCRSDEDIRMEDQFDLRGEGEGLKGGDLVVVVLLLIKNNRGRIRRGPPGG